MAGGNCITLFVVFTKYSFYPNEVTPYVNRCPFVVGSYQENCIWNVFNFARNCKVIPYL